MDHWHDTGHHAISIILLYQKEFWHWCCSFHSACFLLTPCENNENSLCKSDMFLYEFHLKNYAELTISWLLRTVKFTCLLRFPWSFDLRVGYLSVLLLNSMLLLYQYCSSHTYLYFGFLEELKPISVVLIFITLLQANSLKMSFNLFVI